MKAIKKGHDTGRTFTPIHVPDWTKQRSKYARQKWCIYHVLPWYTSFYVSWMEADIEKLFVRYNEHFADQVQSIRRICQFADPEHIPDPVVLKKITEHKDGAFRFGVSGRGVKELP